MTPERYQKMVAVLSRRQPDLTVLIENVHKPHNLAAVVRTADAVGVSDVHAISDSKSFRMRQKAASGSGRWVKTHSHNDIDQAYSKFRQQGLTIHCAHFSEDAVDFRKFDFTQPVALVFGSELEGVSEEAVRKADGNIVIPMLGMVQSLNISVAAALMLFEAQRQRELAGLYEQFRLDPEQFKLELFERCYPDVARYCKSHGLPYPELDEDGYMSEPLGDRLGNIRELP
jgi:tRNA (guanosine-2'-O-)-methyltransferase